jgi:hypothetical protein
MWVELQARRPYSDKWEVCAIDTFRIDTVKPSPSCTAISHIYDQDDLLCWEVDMPYNELVALLNGTDVAVQENPKQPVEVEAWAVVNTRGEMTGLYIDMASAATHKSMAN